MMIEHENAVEEGIETVRTESDQSTILQTTNRSRGDCCAVFSFNICSNEGAEVGDLRTGGFDDFDPSFSREILGIDEIDLLLQRPRKKSDRESGADEPSVFLRRLAVQRNRRFANGTFCKLCL